MIHLVQISNGSSRRVALVEEPTFAASVKCRVSTNWCSAV